MSLRQVVERMYTVATAGSPHGFNTLMAAQVAAAGVAGLDASVTVYKRRSAKFFATEQALPGLGVYCIGSHTNAKRGGPLGSGWRDLTARAVWDYYATGPSLQADAGKLMEQAELAHATILQLIDRMAEDQSTGVIGAGEDPNSIISQLTPELIEDVTVPGIRVLVISSIIQEDRSL
jgi:hypothetical protein